MRIVVAIGGNALLRRGERPDAAPQRRHVATAAAALAGIAREHELVVVHGNGPQVGLLALQSGADTSLSEPYPLADLVAESQGLIGLWLQQALVDEGAGDVVTLVTQTVVDPEDPAFQEPTKLIGQFYDESAAGGLAGRHGWAFRAVQDGWRRVVASPLPCGIVELPVAERLLDAGVTVVLAGGGGVPVVVRDHRYESVDAVVDKDHVAALAAETLDADLLLVLTDVEGVLRDFGGPAETLLREVSPAELSSMRFPAGSMGPKVAAVCAFTRRTGRRAAIGGLDEVDGVLAGTAGTQVRS
ncbi:carbamate kinase [Nocardioides sp. YR527]|uniref:carbamate kinase n=1 Tax=Nocardioides sp. YR527 TaxID=1881028 RepID=UPI00087FA382|nr:carbamate kinase [Nocardioides sp. YR527]SDK53262.1 carbamate kinase [Nocardioides sp. YR527]